MCRTSSARQKIVQRNANSLTVQGEFGKIQMRGKAVIILVLIFTGAADGVFSDPNLVSHWRFEEFAGVTAYDSVGSNNGVVHGAQWTSDAKFGRGLSFGGTDFVNIGDLGVNENWTVSFWAKSSENSGIVYYPIGLRDSHGGVRMGGNHAHLRQHIAIYPDDYTTQLFSTTRVETVVWYHVAITKNDDSYSMYINGKHENTEDLIDIDLDSFNIGIRSDFAGGFKGNIDDVGVWDRALSLGDFVDPEPGTINYVRINGVSGPGYGVAGNPNPVDEQMNSVRDVLLVWRPGDCANDINEHRVYFSDNFDDVNETTVAYAAVNEPNYAVGVLNLNTTYYWRVDEVTDFNTWRGHVWSFTTHPRSASMPYPANNVENASSGLQLSWMPGGEVADPNGHEVYFGTNYNSVLLRRRSLIADLDEDLRVDLNDLLILSSQWLNYVEGFEPRADLNDDNNVDLSDLVIMAGEWKGDLPYQGTVSSNSYDPCDLDYGIRYYWCVDESNDANTWPGEVWSFEIGIEEPVLSNATTHQVIPTYDGSGQAMHPDVAHFSSGWNGYKYWMAMTPFTESNSQTENPSIVVSNDGSSWEVPPGLTNPLVECPASGHNADTDIVYNDDTDELWVYFFRFWGDQVVKLTLMRSSNGVNWSEPEYLITWYRNIAMNEGSYSIVKQGSDWHYWALNLYAPYKVRYRYSTDGRNWSEGQDVTFTSEPIFLPWHLDVIYVSTKSEYWMVYNGPAAPGGSIFFAKSRDKLTWTPTVKQTLTPSLNGWDNKELYRATLLYDSDNELLRVWYSAVSKMNNWHVGYTETNY